MKKNELKTCIGVVTFNRKLDTLRLVKKILPQLSTEDSIFIIENGSRQLDDSDFSFSPQASGQVKIFHLKESSIPKSRNFFLKKASQTCDVIAFIDDDCIPHSHWLTDLKTIFLNHQNVFAIQGSIKSIPKNNMYARVSGILYSYWLKKNSNRRTTKILDTKNCAFRSSIFRGKPLFFNEKYQYATDIEYGIMLQNNKIKIHKAKRMLIHHVERQTYFGFINHRVRLSLAYRNINKAIPEYFTQASSLNKIYILFRKNKFTPLEMLIIFTALLIVYLQILIKTHLLKRGSTSYIFVITG